jgi:hypothetical protein
VVVRDSSGLGQGWGWSLAGTLNFNLVLGYKENQHQAVLEPGMQGRQIGISTLALPHTPFTTTNFN